MGRTGFGQSRLAGSLLHERAHLAHSGRQKSTNFVKNSIFRVDHNLEACWQPRRSFP